jgi:hypothetical protein
MLAVLLSVVMICAVVGSMLKQSVSAPAAAA